MSSASSERTALLPNGDRRHFSESDNNFLQRTSLLFKTEGQPSHLASWKFFLFGSWINVLLVFVPLSIIAHNLDLDAALRFSFSFFAIVPLASLLGTATDEMSIKLGQTLAGLLNASFGNAVEIIVGIAALMQDQLVIVQNSLLGSVLSNILLVLGCSFLAAGFKFPESNFQVTAAQASSSLMTLACITLVIPAAYYSTKSSGNAFMDPHTNAITNMDPERLSGLLIISRGTAILLLVVYVAYLYFQLKSHAYLFTADDEGQEEETPNMNIVSAAAALLIVTVITAFCADYLVASIEEFADRYHIPKPFIGLILLPIVGNAAEHVTSIWMALKGQMELTIGICVGSSIQIAAFVIPLLVIIGWISNHELTLFFANFETIAFFASVFLVNTLIQDGKSNYMEGLMLITLYLVIALAFWVS
ncbi:Sodium/calcium exchanger protein-domain-containing protein [Rhodocollybia butyracea]|uniref:Vacuolar calcium ion transporter n=1 Tax=Rhodocollybia butyracea TaxID=206335 RepID=A0A9P5TYR8_9AGAR|nr:Sodium/calcium exchanger protein-domain-containing protein [Rhodocollybia butyracea]KAF9059509.1 Sodium/calcium exchanger protein-domain-containing protein [Rhodocollybia butyracea]